MFAKLLKLPKVLKFLTHKIDSKTKKDDFTVVFNFAQAEGTGFEVQGVEHPNSRGCLLAQTVRSSNITNISPQPAISEQSVP